MRDGFENSKETLLTDNMFSESFDAEAGWTLGRVKIA